MIDAFDAAERLLSCWQMGLLPAHDIVAWADRLISEARSGKSLPPWLGDISTLGPKGFLKRAERGYPRPVEFSFEDMFEVMVEVTRVDDPLSVRRFSAWLTREVMGGGFNEPIVRQGYMIDALWSNGEESAAMEATIRLLREHQGRCHRIREALHNAMLGWRTGE